MHRCLNWTFRVLRGTSQGYCHRCGTIYGKRNEKCAEHIAVQKQGGTVGPGVKTPNKSSVPGSGGSVCCYGGFAGFLGPWFRNLFRFVVLFHPHQSKSKIGHGEVGWMIMKDESIPGTVVRTSSIPKELGHLVYLLGDKTGTLTQNEMVFKRLLLGTVSYGTDTMDEIQIHIIQSYALV